MKYIDGIQWVLTYYTQGVSDWRWFYPYDYAPFLSDLAKYMDENMYDEYMSKKTAPSSSHLKPYPPYLQLLCVLPPKSKHLLPESIAKLMDHHYLTKFYPSEFEVDMDGKINTWEGIVHLPLLDHEKIEKEYYKVIKTIDDKDKKRNFIGKSMKYSITQDETVFKSYYGDLKNCKANYTLIDL